ncbi:MAG: hypothetical protein ACOC5K_02810 [Chloroflexota bacterium]
MKRTFARWAMPVVALAVAGGTIIWADVIGSIVAATGRLTW